FREEVAYVLGGQQWKYTRRYGIRGGVGLLSLLLWFHATTDVYFQLKDLIPYFCFSLVGGLIGLGIGYFRDTASNGSHTQKPLTHRRYLIESGIKGVLIFLASYLFIWIGVYFVGLLIYTFAAFAFFECEACFQSLDRITYISQNYIDKLVVYIYQRLLIWLLGSFVLGVGWGLVRWQLRPKQAES
ncbi:MAG: hypothetical protein WD972_00335, partial [Candidatus Andersenbacteria bacterium]